MLDRLARAAQAIHYVGPVRVRMPGGDLREAPYPAAAYLKVVLGERGDDGDHLVAAAGQVLHGAGLSQVPGLGRMRCIESVDVRQPDLRAAALALLAELAELPATAAAGAAE